MPFKALGLTDELIKALTEKGYTKPTPIQEQAIPMILEGSDLMAGSQTGTGKTAGFTLPLLQHLSRGPKNQAIRHVRALILTPTRELAAQVAESVVTYGKYLSLKAAVIFGGVGIHAQIKELRNGVDIIIATPGRLLDHVSQKTVDLSKVEILVLDEADRMLDMGFIHDIRRLLALLPKKRQNLLFSATFSTDIKALADGLLNSPKKIEVARHITSAEGVTQVVYPVDSKRKRALLSHLILSEDLKQILVFTRTKHGANRLSEQLSLDGITATAIHGNKSQSARTKALADFKQGIVRVLVATDIAARGLDIDQLPHVVNYELPNVAEDYVHRIGRTGRAGNVGKAISLVCIDEHQLLRDIERLLKRSIQSVTLPDYEPDPSIRAEPIPNGRPQQRGPQQRGPRDHAPKARAPREYAPKDRTPQELSEGEPSNQTSFSRQELSEPMANYPKKDRNESDEPRAARPGRGFQGTRSEGEGPRGAPPSRFGSDRPAANRFSANRSNSGRPDANRSGPSRFGGDRSDSRGSSSGRAGNGYQGRRPQNDDFEGPSRGAPSRFGTGRSAARPSFDRPGSDRPSANRFGADRSDSRGPSSGRPGNGYQGKRSQDDDFEGSSRPSPSRFGPSRPPSANRFGTPRQDSNRSGNSFEDSPRGAPGSRFGASRPGAGRFGADRSDSRGSRSDRPDRSGNSFEDAGRRPNSSRFGASRPGVGRSDERGPGARDPSARGPGARGPGSSRPGSSGRPNSSGRPSSGRPGTSGRPGSNNRSNFGNR